MYQWLLRWFSAARAPEVADSGAPASVPGESAAADAGPADVPARSSLSFEQRDNANANYYDWLFEAEGDAGFEMSAAETQVADTLGAIIKTQQSGAAMVRRLPGLIPQLLQSLRNDSFSGAQLARTISNDVVLVAAVIRLANSALAGSGKTISSVEHAVIVIGQEGLSQLITGVAFRPIIDINSGHFTKLLAPRIWKQSERCAVANRMLAADMGIDPFEAFLAGLVQHVGLIVCLRIMDQATKDSRELGSPMFCAGLLRDARTLTCSIGREWNFPPAVTDAIAEQASTRKGAVLSPLGQLLSLSDYLSKVRILVENARLGEGDTRLFKGLSPQAMACYQKLDAIAEVGAGDIEGAAAPSSANGT